MRAVYDSAPFYAPGPYEAWLLSVCKDRFALAPSKSLADVGGGSGTFAAKLKETIRARWLSVVEPSEEMLSGAKTNPLVDAAECADALSWAEGLPRDASADLYDGVLLKEVVHHLEAADRARLFSSLRTRRLAPDGRALIITRPQHGIDYPLWEAAREVWAANQPSEALLMEELRAAGFEYVEQHMHAYPHAVPVEEWCRLVRGRFWSTFSHFTAEELEQGCQQIRREHSARRSGAATSHGGEDADELRFEDRMLFIVASVADPRPASPSAPMPISTAASPSATHRGSPQTAPPPPSSSGSSSRGASTFRALPGASFHGESVEAMVDACVNREWSPPPLPPAVAEAMEGAARRAHLAASGPQTGRAAREAYFDLDPAWTFLNHGAFGAPCRLGTAAAAAWRAHAERQPLRFIDRELLAHLVESTRAVAEWVGASPSELVLTPNATFGLNAVIASIVGGQLKPGDEVLTSDIGYGSVHKMVERECQRSGAVPVVVRLAEALPASAAPEMILERFERAITPRTRLAIFDDITSNTALRLPVEALCQMCRRRGVLSLVDAAHTVGSLPAATVPWLGHADFAAANLHKWACAPRGTGFLYARAEHQPRLEPPIVSHGYGSGFTSSFIWNGAMDYSSLLALPALIHRWWGDHRLAASVGYQQRLLAEAVDLLADCWGTEPLVMPSGAVNMALVRLPDVGLDADGQPWSSKAAQDTLHFEHSVECPVKTVCGQLYVRVSAAIYNERADYERLANSVTKASKQRPVYDVPYP